MSRATRTLTRLWPLAIVQLALAPLGSCAFAGCAFDWTLPDSAGPGSEGGPSVDASTLDDGPATSDVEVPSTDAGDASDACASNADCTGTMYCAFSDHQCGKGTRGTCQSRATAGCSAITASVCGCDAKTYATACAATQAGVDLSDSLACPTPAGDARCGYRFCATSTTLCELDKGTDTATCVSLAGCSPACSCPVVMKLSACSCAAKPVIGQGTASEIVVTCP